MQYSGKTGLVKSVLYLKGDSSNAKEGGGGGGLN